MLVRMFWKSKLYISMYHSFKFFYYNVKKLSQSPSSFTHSNIDRSLKVV